MSGLARPVWKRSASLQCVSPHKISGWYQNSNVFPQIWVGDHYVDFFRYFVIFFQNCQSLVIYCISCSYFPGVAVGQLRWQSSRMSVIQRRKQVHLLNKKSLTKLSLNGALATHTPSPRILWIIPKFPGICKGWSSKSFSMRIFIITLYISPTYFRPISKNLKRTSFGTDRRVDRQRGGWNDENTPWSRWRPMVKCFRHEYGFEFIVYNTYFTGYIYV